MLEPLVSRKCRNPGRLLNYTLEAGGLACSVEVNISNHIKAWKNLLLRGEKPEEYSKYLAEMDACTGGSMRT